MKKANKFILLFSVSALLSLTAAAKSPESTYIQNCAKSPEIPVPVAVVSPSVAQQYAGATVELEFTVDTAGRPTELSVKYSPDEALAATVLTAVKQWRFTPAQLNGTPVAKKVSLPVKIVAPEFEGTRYAMN